MTFDAPYLIFLGDMDEIHHAKPGLGLRDWAPERCLGQVRLPDCGITLGLPDMTIQEAAARGARTMVLGLANVGGTLSARWTAAFVEALEAGLDLASGMHARLSDIPAVAEAAEKHGRRLFDVRHMAPSFSTGTGEPRPGKRILTVGTDCVVGKKYTALALTRGLRARGLDATFRATGQTGFMIAGRGVAVDAVKSDFLAGAAEWLSPANTPEHWDVIEGQGSLYHPAYAAVTLGLLHGSQPDYIVLCHDPRRKHIEGFPRFPIPALDDAIAYYLQAGRLTSPDIACAGISLNTAGLDDDAAERVVQETQDRLGLPCTDPVRFGTDRLLDALLDRERRPADAG